MAASKQKLREFLAGEQGATAVEYGLFLAAIAAALVAILFSLGGTVNSGIASFKTEFEKSTSGG